MMNAINFNVFLTGGGMKGAYQYGFFKQLHACTPHININKIYSVSVGSLNAIPILTNRVKYLERFWESSSSPPYTILETWPTLEEAAINKTLFKSFNQKPIKSFLSSLPLIERHMITEKLTIMSYNKLLKEPVFYDKMFFTEDILKAIQISSAYPTLVPQLDPHITDGAFVGLDMILEHIDFNTDTKWIILDIGGVFTHYTPSKNTLIYQPSVVTDSKMNLVSCVITNRLFIDSMIFEGEQDALRFMSRHIEPKYLSPTCSLGRHRSQI